ncbi:hypothetical protein SEA_LYSIDIOUS_41 [Gordonia phage Lysidious]|nr:hypothetical protein SEA_LYSIDIOUS_41 [Gordonia phage Lysidious]
MGLSKEAAAKDAGISSITWKRVEDAQPVRDVKLRSIELTLGWDPGDAYLVGDGVLDPNGRRDRAPAVLHATLEKLDEDVYDDYKSDIDHAGETSATIRSRIEKTVAATVEAAGSAVADDEFVHAVTSQVVRHERGWIASRVEQLPLHDCLAVADYIVQFEVEPDEEQENEGENHVDSPTPQGAPRKGLEGEKTDDADDYDLVGRDVGEVSETEMIRRQMDADAERGDM